MADLVFQRADLVFLMVDLAFYRGDLVIFPLSMRSGRIKLKGMSVIDLRKRVRLVHTKRILLDFCMIPYAYV